MTPEDRNDVSRLLARSRKSGLVLVLCGIAAFSGPVWLSRGTGLPWLADGLPFILMAALLLWMVSSFVVDHGFGREPLVVFPRGVLDVARATVGAAMVALGLLTLWMSVLGVARLRNATMLPFGAFFLVWGLGRTKLLDEGIWQEWRLLRWSRIRSSWWENRSPSGSTLHLEIESRMFPYRKLHVRPEQQATVARILEERAGTAGHGTYRAASH